MRILHISSVYPPQVVGGAERVVEILAEAQVARGHGVGAAYLTPEPRPSGIRNGVTVLPQADRSLIWMEDVPKRPRLMRTASKVLQVLNTRTAGDFGRAMRSFAPDIVHTHSMVDLPPMLWTEIAKSGARSVHTLHDYDLICARASLFRNGRSCERRHPSCVVMSRWKARFADRIDVVAAVSGPVLDEHRRYGLFVDLPPARARVVWNGVRTAAVPAARASAAARTGPLVFGFLGRLVPEKGIEVLLDACRALPADGWQLKIAGRALGSDEVFRKRAAGLPAEFLGFTDAHAFLDTIDVLVVPSIWREPFGMTVVEAFSHGVPVIGADLGAIRDLVGAIGRDWLVPSGDVVALAARMAEAMRAGRAALPPPAAFADVLEAVSVDRMVAAYDAIYRDLVPQDAA